MCSSHFLSPFWLRHHLLASMHSLLSLIYMHRYQPQVSNTCRLGLKPVQACGRTSRAESVGSLIYLANSSSFPTTENQRGIRPLSENVPSLAIWLTWNMCNEETNVLLLPERFLLCCHGKSSFNFRESKRRKLITCSSLLSSDTIVAIDTFHHRTTLRFSEAYPEDQLTGCY